jgi:hypothetical protein
MAGYFVLSEKATQELVQKICDWVDLQCCNMWQANPDSTVNTATFEPFKVDINAGGVRVTKYRPDLKTVDYDICVHFDCYSTVRRLVAAALRIKPILLEAEAYTRHLERTNIEHDSSLTILNKCLLA